MIEAFDGHIYINIEDKIYTSRKLLDHEIYSQEFDQAPENKRKTQVYSPTISPVETRVFQRYLRSIGKTLEEYEAERAA